MNKSPIILILMVSLVVTLGCAKNLVDSEVMLGALQRKGFRPVDDPANADLIYPPFNCGDGIHPSPIGYFLMGKSVDLGLFQRR